MADLGWADAWVDYGYTQKALRQYLAPERFDRENEKAGNFIPEKSDIFAMGVIATELLQGRHPAKNLKSATKSNGSWIRWAQRHEPDLSGINSDRLKSLISRCLNPNCEVRPTAEKCFAEICCELREVHSLDVEPTLKMWRQDISNKLGVSKAQHAADVAIRTISLGGEQERRSREKLEDFIEGVEVSSIETCEDWVILASCLLCFYDREDGEDSVLKIQRLRESGIRHLESIFSNFHRDHVNALPLPKLGNRFEWLAGIIKKLADVADITYEKATNGEVVLADIALAALAFKTASLKRIGRQDTCPRHCLHRSLKNLQKGQIVVNELINNLLPSIEHFRVGGYWIAFFAALFETTIGIGLFLPGSTIILFLGALSARGYLDTGDLIWFAVLGAILGDNTNYYLGRRYGAKWLNKGFWLLKANHIEKARCFMDTHGAKSVFLGRFIPSVKEVVPFIAGSVTMNKRTFMFWNVLGAVGWGFEWVLAGYIFAQSLNVAELWLSRAGLLFAFLLILGGIFYFFKWLIIKKGKQFLIIGASLWQSIKEAATNNDHVILWVQKHPRSISFWQARLDTKAFSGLTLSILTLAFIYVFALFAGVVEDLITADPIVAADIRISNLFFVIRTDAITNIFSWITLLGKSQVIIGFIAISVALLWLWRKSYYILSLFIAVAGSEAFTYLGKLAFHRPRPELAVYAEHSFSFPSGHATIAVAFYGFAGYLLARSVRSWSRKVNIFFTTILIIIAIGFSRIYLGVHYISDVWSGYLVGTMWLIIAISFSEWLGHQKNSDKSLSPIAWARPITFVLVFIAILFYAVFSTNYHPQLASVPSNNAIVVSKSTDIFTNEQMKYTETLIGEKQEPLNVIFLAKDDNQLTAALQQAGWVVTDKPAISSFIQAVKALIVQTPHPSAPISPSFWNTKIQDLSFAKVPGRNWLRNAFHLRIWRTSSLLKNGNRIYAGMVNGHDGFKWGIIPKIIPDLDVERELLYQDLRHSEKIESHLKVQLVKPLIGKNFMGNHFFTDGKAYIITVQ